MENQNQNYIEMVSSLKPIFWENNSKINFLDFKKDCKLTFNDIKDADERLQRFAPLIKKLFPETENGIIESPLLPIPHMKERTSWLYNKNIEGELYLKCDSHLKIAGSVKARGGIYEVLKYAETLAFSHGLLSETDNYEILAEKIFKEFFSNFKITVGSTGNLGLSIGIISAALGFKVIVHMSKDAKEWKKALLHSKGVEVIEHNDDYSRAVEEGRKQCLGDSACYFIDDEKSKDLLLGYSVAALRLAGQLGDQGIVVDDKHPLFVYLPCGVGGAPGGITFGLKHLYGDNVHCYFVEPTHSPCMLLGLLTREFNKIHVGEYGIDNITEADGLAVGSPSELVSKLAEKLIDGIYTIEDRELFELLTLLKDSESIRIEPSAAAGFKGPAFIKAHENTTHIVWATGGLLLPDEVYSQMYQKGKNLLYCE